VWPRRRHKPATPPHRGSVGEPVADIVAEAVALVEGRVLDRMWSDGQPIPAWVWMNALAHRPTGEVGDLIGVAYDQPGDPWADAVVDIALYLTEIIDAEAARIQAELFAPAELEVLSGRSPPDCPGRLVRAVRRRLVTSTYRSAPDQHP
jgi:hypothetical protein